MTTQPDEFPRRGYHQYDLTIGRYQWCRVSQGNLFGHLNCGSIREHPNTNPRSIEQAVIANHTRLPVDMRQASIDSTKLGQLVSRFQSRQNRSAGSFALDESFQHTRIDLHKLYVAGTHGPLGSVPRGHHIGCAEN